MLWTISQRVPRGRGQVCFIHCIPYTFSTAWHIKWAQDNINGKNKGACSFLFQLWNSLSPFSLWKSKLLGNFPPTSWGEDPLSSKLQANTLVRDSTHKVIKAKFFQVDEHGGRDKVGNSSRKNGGGHSSSLTHPGFHCPWGLCHLLGLL